MLVVSRADTADTGDRLNEGKIKLGKVDWRDLIFLLPREEEGRKEGPEGKHLTRFCQTTFFFNL